MFSSASAERVMQAMDGFIAEIGSHSDAFGELFAEAVQALNSNEVAVGQDKRKFVYLLIACLYKNNPQRVLEEGIHILAKECLQYEDLDQFLDFISEIDSTTYADFAPLEKAIVELLSTARKSNVDCAMLDGKHLATLDRGIVEIEEMKKTRGEQSYYRRDYEFEFTKKAFLPLHSKCVHITHATASIQAA